MDNLEEMDKFLERYNLPRLNHEETENMSRQITSNEIESVTKKLPTNKSPGSDAFRGECCQTLKEELTSILLKLFQIMKRKQCSEHIPWGQHHSDTKTKDTIKKGNYQPISLINIDAKILNKILANQIQQYIKRIIYHDQVGFIPEMQGWLNICKSMWYSPLTNWRIKFIWSSHNVEKAFDKIQHSFMIKTLNKVRLEET